MSNLERARDLNETHGSLVKSQDKDRNRNRLS